MEAFLLGKKIAVDSQDKSVFSPSEGDVKQSLHFLARGRLQFVFQFIRIGFVEDDLRLLTLAGFTSMG